jgi:phospholipase/lecithinase/hemolysin
VVANPGAYGLTDVTDPCFNGLTVCSNPNQYLFWDGDHPTTYADSLLAAQFQSAIPEPSTLLMLCTSIVGLAGVLRRKMAV